MVVRMTKKFKCSECYDRGYYKIWSGRGESEEIYCEKKCQASIKLKAVDQAAREMKAKK